MAFTFNGIGTRFYGQRDFREDGSYITTEWIVIIYLSVVPIGSLRVGYLGQGDDVQNVPPIIIGSSTRFAVLEKTRPNWKQVLSTYGYVALLLAWACLVGKSMVAIFPRAFDTLWSLNVMFFASLLPIPTPWVLRYFAKRQMTAEKAHAGDGGPVGS